MSHIVVCDRCAGAGCSKCGYYGSIVIQEAPRSARTVAGAIIWYVFLGLVMGGLIVWVLRGVK